MYENDTKNKTKENIMTEKMNPDFKFVDKYGFNEDLLKEAFAEARKIYKERGFMREMGQGKAPAITTVDMAKAWMSEGHPFTCDKSEEVCANALKVLEAGRKAGVPCRQGWRLLQAFYMFLLCRLVLYFLSCLFLLFCR